MLCEHSDFHLIPHDRSLFPVENFQKYGLIPLFIVENFVDNVENQWALIKFYEHYLVFLIFISHFIDVIHNRLNSYVYDIT